MEHYGDISSFQPEEIAELFTKSFGNAFDADIWHWKYGEGRGRAVCIRQNNDIVAHYGGAPRDILYFGQPARAIQICDVMVLPEKRGFYSRKGLFFRSASAFLEQQAGYSARHLLGVGFPNIKAMRVAVRLGLYEKTDDFIEVVYPALSERDTLSTNSMQSRVSMFDPVNQDDLSALGGLWEQMRSGFDKSIIGMRDWPYLQYRYFRHPYSQRYTALKVEDASTGQLTGLMITRQHSGFTLIMDILASPNRLPAVIESCQRYLQKQTDGELSLRCWITQAQASLIHLPGVTEHSLQIEIPCNRWTNGPETQTLTGAWWLTAGDMDFM